MSCVAVSSHIRFCFTLQKLPSYRLAKACCLAIGQSLCKPGHARLPRQALAQFSVRTARSRSTSHHPCKRLYDFRADVRTMLLDNPRILREISREPDIIIIYNTPYHCIVSPCSSPTSYSLPFYAVLHGKLHLDYACHE